MGRKKSAPAEQLDAEKGRGIGDNVLGQASQEHLKTLEGRIMRLLDQRDEINADIKEVFAEVSDAGFHPPTLRKAISRKRAMDKDPEGFRSAEEQLETYFAALYQPDLPFESLNPHMAEQRKTPAKPKAVAAPVAAEDPGAPTPAETTFN